MKLQEFITEAKKAKKDDTFDIWKYVVKKDGKWALISKNTGRVLRYFKGEGKPSQEWVDTALRDIEYFKHNK